MARKISLAIVSPERPVSKEDVDFVVLPTERGELGVLPGHTHLLTELAPGALRITRDGEVGLFAVSGGFVEIHPESVSVFAETAEMAKEINVERARLAAERAKQELAKGGAPQDIANAQASLRRALIRLHVAENLSRRHLQK